MESHFYSIICGHVGDMHGDCSIFFLKCCNSCRTKVLYGCLDYRDLLLSISIPKIGRHLYFNIFYFADTGNPVYPGKELVLDSRTWGHKVGAGTRGQN